MSTLPLPLRATPLSLNRPLQHRDVLGVCQRLLVSWLMLRTAAWTLVAWTQPNPPLDVVEWLAWGRELQLGYHKHPPLAAWIAEGLFRLTPGSFVGIYFVGYASIGLALWCVWNLARQLVPPRSALAATLCLDGLIYLGAAVAEFNNQVLLVAFWTIAIERFHAAVLQDRWRDWILTGLALGLALLCKYSALLLIVPLLAWWLLVGARNGSGKRRWTRPALVASVALIVFLPHLVWLIQHDFPTLHYAAQRTQSDRDALDPRLAGLVFLGSQAVRLLPVVLILWPILRWTRRQLDETASLSRSLLTAAVLGPVALHLALSLIGLRLRDIWGMSLWTFAGLLLVCWVKTEAGGRSWSRLRLLWGLVFFVSLGITLLGNVYGSAVRARPMRVHCPGQLLAEEITSRYRQRFGVAPAIIAGDWWLAGNVACHASPRPMVYASREPAYVGLDLSRDRGDPRRFLSPDPAASPWTNDADFRQRGGVLLWDATTYGEDLPPWLADRFPEAQNQKALAPRYLGGSSARLRVGWALLPPAR